MFPHLGYSLYALNDEVAHLNWLHLHCAVVQACDAYFIESFSEESITLDRRGRGLCGVLHCSTPLGKLSTSECEGRPQRV